jgi:hypothetical protein
MTVRFDTMPEKTWAHENRHEMRGSQTNHPSKNEGWGTRRSDFKARRLIQLTACGDLGLLH